MSRLMLTVAALVLASCSQSQARFLVDDFEIPGPGSHISDGTTLTLASPNFFSSRTLDQLPAAGTVLTINGGPTNGNITSVFTPGDQAFIEWAGPVTTRGFASLEFTDFAPIGVANTITYDVTLNGASINSTGAPQVLASNGILSTTAQTLVAGDLLRVTFNGIAPVSGFTATAIFANPEPMSAGLLGLAMFGGVCRHRRRRRTAK